MTNCSPSGKKTGKRVCRIGEDQILTLLSGNYGLEIVVDGAHPSPDDIGLANTGRIDALIIDMAKTHNATLYTSDKLQHLVAQTQGVQQFCSGPRPKRKSGISQIL